MVLPGGAYCAGLARQAVRSLLDRHGLAELRDTAVLAASELVAAAYRFTPDREMILRVRRQFEALRIVLYDQHPAHPSADKAEECRDRRSRSMWLLAAAVDTQGGDWGLAVVLTPGGGTKSWALLHR
ncbi:ATP-binding protein [Streptomyces sp. NPDC058579]|uniref:ATP-binding protein n=1 Tax=Streptomyces sp. NPDC058579 TaxID=3346548 RepID=UPI003667D81F